MKYLLNCRSLIRATIIMVVVVFMALQVTDTNAGRKSRKVEVTNWDENPCCGPCGGGTPWQWSATVSGDSNTTQVVMNETIPIPQGMLLEIKSLTYRGSERLGRTPVIGVQVEIQTKLGFEPVILHNISNPVRILSTVGGNRARFSQNLTLFSDYDIFVIAVVTLESASSSTNPVGALTLTGCLYDYPED